MCGIAGIVAHEGEEPRSALQAMIDAQRHRGPNDEGMELSRGPGYSLALGQRRLSIIDLSPSGHQPMIHEQTGDQIVFNGEIYNFQALRNELEREGVRFRGHCDTEVLLEALVRWGPSCVKRMEGMFAFAFYDRRKHQLLLARDALGIKPLYYAATPRAFVFASEVRAILASGLVPRKLDDRGMAGLLAYGAVQEPCTFFQDIASLAGGCWQVVRLPTYFEEPMPPAETFWTFPAPDASARQGETVLRLQATMEAAVRDHLVADVPVGVFLSSGLDSTIVAGLASRHTRQLRTFTVGFADQPEFSESALAAETAQIFGARHTDIQIKGDQAQAAAVAWMASLDMPSLDGLNTYVISKAIRAEGITVALSGLGGDELFAGYPSFVDLPRVRQHVARARHLGPAVRRLLVKAVAFGRSESFRHKLADILATNGELLELYFQRRRMMSNKQLETLGVDARLLHLTSSFLPPEALQRVVVDSDDVVWSVSQFESRFYMGNMLLHDTDTNGMAHSLEIRVPMLDKRVLDLALALPGQIRMPDSRVSKQLLRQAFSSVLRPELTTQKKRGFTLPISRWMVGPLREMCEESLRGLKSLDVLQTKGVDAVWQAFLREPTSPIWSRAFALCVLGSYMKAMNVTR